MCRRGTVSRVRIPIDPPNTIDLIDKFGIFQALPAIGKTLGFEPLCALWPSNAPLNGAFPHSANGKARARVSLNLAPRFHKPQKRKSPALGGASVLIGKALGCQIATRLAVSNASTIAPAIFAANSKVAPPQLALNLLRHRLAISLKRCIPTTSFAVPISSRSETGRSSAVSVVRMIPAAALDVSRF